MFDYTGEFFSDRDKYETCFLIFVAFVGILMAILPPILAPTILDDPTFFIAAWSVAIATVFMVAGCVLFRKFRNFQRQREEERRLQRSAPLRNITSRHREWLSFDGLIPTIRTALQGMTPSNSGLGGALEEQQQAEALLEEGECAAEEANDDCETALSPSTSSTSEASNQVEMSREDPGAAASEVQTETLRSESGQERSGSPVKDKCSETTDSTSSSAV